MERQGIPIVRGLNDAYYRYRMEPIQTKVEGKGNGIKTVIPNLGSIGQSLSRKPDHILKFFGYEIGAQTSDKGSRYIINGAHESAKLQDLLDVFINRFVLCQSSCRNPETDFVLEDNKKTLSLKCKACPNTYPVPPGHKLISNIVKNLLEAEKQEELEKKAARKAARRANASAQATEGADGAQKNGDSKEDGGKEASASDSENGKNGKKADESAYGDDPELAKLRAEAARVDAATSKPKEETWASDQSAAAVAARQASLPDEFKDKLALEDGGASVYDNLGEWTQDLLTSGKEKRIQTQNGLIFRKASELNIEHKPKTVQVLVQTVFDANIVEQIPERAILFQKVFEAEDDEEDLDDDEELDRREKYEKALLGGTERLLGVLSKDHPAIIPKVVDVLKAYREARLLKNNAVVNKWGTTSSTKYTDRPTSAKVRKAAKPFLDWLETAPELSESEYESDSDDE